MLKIVDWSFANFKCIGKIDKNNTAPENVVCCPGAQSPEIYTTCLAYGSTIRPVPNMSGTAGVCVVIEGHNMQHSGHMGQHFSN